MGAPWIAAATARARGRVTAITGQDRAQRSRVGTDPDSRLSCHDLDRRQHGLVEELAEVFFMCRMGKNLARLEQDRTQYDRGRFAMLAEKLFLTDREDRGVAGRGFEIA